MFKHDLAITSRRVAFVGDSWRDWHSSPLRHSSQTLWWWTNRRWNDSCRNCTSQSQHRVFFVLQFLIIDQVVVDPIFQKPSKIYKKTPLIRYHHNDLSHDSEAVQPVCFKINHINPSTIPAFNIYLLGQPTFNQLVITTPPPGNQPGANLVPDFHRARGRSWGLSSRGFWRRVDYFSSWSLGWRIECYVFGGGEQNSLGTYGAHMFSPKNSLGAVSSLRFSVPFFPSIFPRFLNPPAIFGFGLQPQRFGGIRCMADTFGTQQKWSGSWRWPWPLPWQ